MSPREGRPRRPERSKAYTTSDRTLLGTGGLEMEELPTRQALRGRAAARQKADGMSAVEAPGGLLKGAAVPGAGQDVVALYREPYGPVRSWARPGFGGWRWRSSGR